MTWKNKEKRSAWQRRYQQERRRWMNSLKEGKPCSECGGIFHPVAMSWHHRDPATKLFAVGAKSTRSKEAILAEIEKCDLMCANCHMTLEHSNGR